MYFGVTFCKQIYWLVVRKITITVVSEAFNPFGWQDKHHVSTLIHQPSNYHCANILVMCGQQWSNCNLAHRSFTYSGLIGVGLINFTLQGVYSSHFMSRVEAFATGIKIESSNQSSDWGLIK